MDLRDSEGSPRVIELTTKMKELEKKYEELRKKSMEFLGDEVALKVELKK